MKSREESGISISLEDKTEYYAIDIFRLIFAIGVVALHLSVFKGIDDTVNYFIVNVLTRLCVPFFFLVSGFFLQKKINDFGKVKSYVVKLIRLYLIYTVLYLPLIIDGKIREGGSWIKKTVLFFRDFLLSTSYRHLWYFVALIVSAILLYLLINKTKLSDKWIAVIVLILYAVGTIVNAYITPLIESIDIPISQFSMVDKKHLLLWLYLRIFSTTRNGIFFGLPYVFFGYVIAKYRHNIRRKNYLFMSIISFVFMTIEAVITLKVFKADGQDMLFMLLPTSVFILLFILFIDCKSNKKIEKIAKNCRKLSVLYYGFHLLIYAGVNYVFEEIFGIQIYNIIMFLVVILVNYIIGQLIIYLSNTKYLKWLKILY